MKRAILLLVIILSFCVQGTAQKYTSNPGYFEADGYSSKYGIAPSRLRTDTSVIPNRVDSVGVMIYWKEKNSVWIKTKLNGPGPLWIQIAVGGDLSQYWDSTFVKANFPIDTVSTITQLQAYNGKSKIVYVTDSTRGGLFLLSSGMVDNGVRFSGVSGRIWERSRQQSNYYKMSWYGIVANGSDQYATINAMLSNIPDYATVVAEQGKTYSISNKILITKPVTIIGNNSTLQFTGGNIEIVSIRSSDVTINGLNVKGNTNATYQGLGKCIITENGSPTNYYTNINILNCKVSNHRYGGIYLRYVDRFNIEGNKCDSFPYVGIIVFSCTNGFIRKNIVNNIHGTGSAGLNAYGISLSKNNTTSTDSVCENIVVTDNIVTNVPTWEGIDAHGGKQLSFIGNHVTGTLRGISIVDEDDTNPSGPKNIVISNNIVNSEGVSNDGNLYALYFTGSDPVLDYAIGTITGNTFVGGGAYLRTTRAVTVSGNIFIRPWNAGVYLNHDNVGTSIVSNTIIDVYQQTGSNASAITATATGNNNAFIAGNALVRGDMAVPGGGSVNAFGYRSNGVIATNTATFGFNRFEGASFPYFNLNDPIQININGSPESTIIAPPGSTAINKTGGAGNTFFVKETGTGNTGWIKVLTATSGAPITGGTGYIQNQSAAAQSSSFWTSGTGRTDSTFTVSTSIIDGLVIKQKSTNDFSLAFNDASNNLYGRLGDLGSLNNVELASFGRSLSLTSVNLQPVQIRVNNNLVANYDDTLITFNVRAAGLDPVNSNDLVTKNYVDSSALSFHSKMSQLVTQPALPIQPTDSLTQSLGKLQAQINGVSGTYIENQLSTNQTADMRITGQVQSSGGGVKVNGAYSGGLSGPGVEMAYNGSAATLAGYNRTTAAYITTRIDGNNLLLNTFSSANIGLRQVTPLFPVDITGTTRVGGANYKMFFDRTSVSGEDNIIAWRSPGSTSTDTIGYIGLASRSDNTFYMLTRKAGMQFRVPVDSTLSFSTHVDGVGTSRKVITNMKNGRWMWGDSLLTTAAVPIQIMNAQDTSLYAAHKIIATGVISNGAVAKPFLSTAITSNTTLNDTHHTVRVTTSGVTITLPVASSCPGREYCIINYNSGGTVNTSAFLSPTAVSTTTVATGASVWIQSDGSNWYQIK